MNARPCSGKPIETKSELIAALKEAAEIEHQLMIQYLYAAFSLKKRPDARCSPAQLEHVRRWGSTLLMVARQEMEHLALVNGLLSALDAAPWFSRENIPRQSFYFVGTRMARFKTPGRKVVPCNIPFVFERFNLPTIGRFVCMESPSYPSLVKSGDPIPTWCFGTKQRPCRPLTAGLTADSYPPSRSHLVDLAEREAALLTTATSDTTATVAKAALAPESALGVDSIMPGTIQELYDRIGCAIHELPAALLFTGNPSRQVFVPVEYQVNIFPITDVASADLALELIVEEGEGIDAPPGYESHFRRFFDIHSDLTRLLDQDPHFEPALPLPLNPELDRVTHRFARQVFELFNYTYATLLFLLTSLYRNFQPAASQTGYPYFSLALQEAAFGPMMTMLIRPLAEVLAVTKSGDGQYTTGPNYDLADRDLELLEHDPKKKLDDINFFLERFGVIIEQLDRAMSHDELATAPAVKTDRPFLDRQLRFVYESATAMRNNLRRIYQIGELPQFIVSP